MKKTCVVIYSIIMGIFLIGCSEKTDFDENTKYSALNDSVVGIEKSDLINENAEISESSEENDELYKMVRGDGVEIEAIKIGNEKYGYVYIPSSWHKFVDIGNVNVEEDKKDIQYCANPTNIITLNLIENKMDGLDAGDSDINNMDLETIAQGFCASKKIVEGVDFEYTPARIGNYNGYILGGVYDDGIALFIFIFKPEDGKVRYIAVEGTKEELSNDTLYYPNTFTLK